SAGTGGSTTSAWAPLPGVDSDLLSKRNSAAPANKNRGTIPANAAMVIFLAILVEILCSRIVRLSLARVTHLPRMFAQRCPRTCITWIQFKRLFQPVQALFLTAVAQKNNSDIARKGSFARCFAHLHHQDF